MKVSFLTFPDILASARLRQHIPARELAKLGVECVRKSEILICSKHGWPEELMAGYEKIIFDVCDDYFDTEWAQRYRVFCKLAEAVVCNSEAMRFRIFQETNVVATVIPDPWETDEIAPSWGEGLLWFGHPLNLPELMRESRNLNGYDLTIVSEPVTEKIVQWSPEVQAKALEKCAMVVLPTGRSACKSANRMITAIRAGKFVSANPLPAYEEFQEFAWVGDIREGVDWAHANKDEALRRVRAGQEYIKTKFSPEIVGGKWLEVIKRVSEKVAA